MFRRTTMKSEKPANSMLFDISSIGGILRIALRALQLVMALTICGMYGHDLNNARKAHDAADPRWTFAVVIAGLSSITAIAFSLPLLKAWMFFGWDAFLFLMWTVIFGIFGKLFMKVDAKGDKGITRMKHAVWVDLVNMLLWFISGAYGLYIFLKARKEKAYGARAEVTA